MISELNTIQGSTASRYLSSSQSFLCTLQRVTSETSPTLRLHAPYKHAATLDTEPVATSYSGGSPTRLSSKHFQYARSPLCSSASWSAGRCGRHHRMGNWSVRLRGRIVSYPVRRRRNPRQSAGLRLTGSPVSPPTQSRFALSHGSTVPMTARTC